MRVGRAVIVNGKSYPVTEKTVLLKADLGGVFGWASVWAPTEGLLQRRIATVLSEGTSLATIARVK